jgi:hypothetical protein
MGYGNGPLGWVVEDRQFNRLGKRAQAAATGLLLSFVREGDTVVCHSMDRMARTYRSIVVSSMARRTLPSERASRRTASGLSTPALSITSATGTLRPADMMT